MDEGIPQPFRMQAFKYRLWWPIRLALFFFGGISDVRLCIGVTSHPEKPIWIILVDDRNPKRGFASMAWNVATARQNATHILSVCDQIETWREAAKDLPPPREGI